MDKLKELLNTFEEEGVEKLKSDVWKNDTISPRIWSKSDITIYNKLQVISKEFGFIKWLVKNDEIDLKEFHRLCGIINQDSEYWNGIPPEYEQVIMYLSISDTPIEDLVSLLK